MSWVSKIFQLSRHFIFPAPEICHGAKIFAIRRVVDTQMTQKAGEEGFAQAFVETWTPMKRMASPQEIADVIVFLCE